MTLTAPAAAAEAPSRARPAPGALWRALRTERVLVMGILNTTPDSFSDGGRYFEADAAVARARTLAAEGADLIDVGGESTRPGAACVPPAEELRRTIPVIERLAREAEVAISIDTSKAEVAEAALAAGAVLVNDVTALRGDARMARVIAQRGAGVVLMHMAGDPRTMQRQPGYRDVVETVRGFLREAVRRAHRAGIAPERILIDPGLGFGKTPRHNLELMAHLRHFTRLGCPVLVGPSRKSFIGATLGLPTAQRLSGTLACVAAAWQAGVRVVRVHDVRETVHLIGMLDAIHRAKG